MLDVFYPWLKLNEERFDFKNDITYDYSFTETISFYPEYNAIHEKAELTNFKYDNLLVNLETIRNYLFYKNKDVSEIKLITSAPVSVKFYYNDGREESFVTTSPILLKDVIYFVIEGEGVLESLEIVGF